MRDTSIRITGEARDCLNELTKLYNQKSVSEMILLLSRYLQKNEINLNFDVKNDAYNAIKIQQENFDEFSKTLFKNEERIIKILRRFEIDYFVKMIVSNNLKSKKEITSVEDNINFNLDELLNKIEIEESKVTGKIKYYLNISEKELENLKQNAR